MSDVIAESREHRNAHGCSTHVTLRLGRSEWACDRTGETCPARIVEDTNARWGAR